MPYFGAFSIEQFSNPVLSNLLLKLSILFLILGITFFNHKLQVLHLYNVSFFDKILHPFIFMSFPLFSSAY